MAGDPAPRPVYLPFPAWLETKNRIAAQLEDTRKNFGDRSREWEEKEQVSWVFLSVISHPLGSKSPLRCLFWTCFLR